MRDRNSSWAIEAAIVTWMAAALTLWVVVTHPPVFRDLAVMVGLSPALSETLSLPFRRRTAY